jgi:glyoxylase-like metal-dependent hydrolase (beta-lactamase superfamily II)
VLIAGFPSQVTATNCWVIASGVGEQCVIVDPGIGVQTQLDELITANRLHPVAVLLTHGHIDHTFSVVPVCQARDVPAFIHADDRVQLTDPWTYSGLRPGEPLLGVANLTVAEPDDVRQVADSAVLPLAGLDIRVRHAAGHTAGSIMFELGAANTPTVFSGDVLFAGSIGRVDLPGGSMVAMSTSLRTVVLPMDDATVVHPGHGPSTTIGRERRYNPFLVDLQ